MNKAERKKAILNVLQKTPDQYFTAFKMNDALGIKREDDLHAWRTHAVLVELKAEGRVERLRGKGFKHNGKDTDKKRAV